MKQLNLENLGRLKRITGEDFSVRHYLDEQVMTIEHILEFESDELVVESEFSCPKGLFQLPSFDQTKHEGTRIYLNGQKENRCWLNSADHEQLIAWIHQAIEQDGGFEELAKIEVLVDLDKLDQKSCTINVYGHEEDEEGIVAYVDIEGIDQLLMLWVHESEARQVLNREPSEQLTLLDLADEGSQRDIPIACAYPYLGDEVYHNVLAIIQEPLHQALNQFMDEYEKGITPHICLTQLNGQLQPMKH